MDRQVYRLRTALLRALLGYHPPNARDAQGLAVRMVDGGRTPGRRREKGDRRLTVDEGSVRTLSVEKRRRRKVMGVVEVAAMAMAVEVE